MNHSRLGKAARTLAVALAASMFLTGCPLLNSSTGETVVDNLRPDVDASELQLRHGPSLEELAAHYCPDLFGDPITGAICAELFGLPPHPSRLAFEFGIVVTIDNPNDVPIPALDVLVALTLFEERDSEALGAICVSLCGQDDPECDGSPREGACESTEEDITSIEDFVNRLPGLIEDIATGEALEEIRKGTIAAGGNVQLDLAFTLGIEQALSVFEKVLVQFVDEYVAGNRETKVEIPVAAVGSVFVRVPALGRVGINWGPLESSWVIDF